MRLASVKTRLCLRSREPFFAVFWLWQAEGDIARGAIVLLNAIRWHEQMARRIDSVIPTVCPVILSSCRVLPCIFSGLQSV